MKMSHTSRSFLERKSPYVDELPSHVCIRITESSISAASLFLLHLKSFRAIEKFSSLKESGALPGSAMPTFRTPSMSRKMIVSTGSKPFESDTSISTDVSARKTFMLSAAPRNPSALLRCCKLKPVPICTSAPDGSKALMYVWMIRTLASVLCGVRASRYDSADCSELTVVPPQS